MPRSISAPSNTYDAGTYTFTVNNISRNDTDKLRLTMTVEDWPQEVNPLFTASIIWDTGDGIIIPVAGRQINKDGTPKSQIRIEVDVPQLANGKAAVKSAEAKFELSAPITTAVKFEALRSDE